MKKLLALLLAAVMILSMAACVAPAPGTPAPEAEKTDSEDKGSDGEAAPAEADSDPSTWPVIRQELISWGEDTARKEEVNKALNDYLVSINAGVQVEMVTLSDRNTQLTLMLTDPDNGIDLFGWRFYSNVNDLVKNDQIISLEKYREVYPELWELYPDPVYLTQQVNGEQYSMPAADAFGGLLVYNLRKDICEEIGVMDLVGTRITMEQLEEILEKAEEIHPELDYIPNSDFPSIMNIDDFGDSRELGVLLNRGIDQDKIVNWYASDEFREVCERMKRWADKGFFVVDPLNNTTGSIDDNQSGGSAFDAYSAEYAQAIQDAQIRKYKVCVFELSDWVGTNSGVCNGFVISSVCKNPDAAMKLLYLEMTDQNVARFFTLGIEGVTYQVLENGTSTYAEGITDENVGFNLTAPWWYPNPTLSAPFNTDYADYYVNMKKCWDYPADKFSKGMGFVFDSTPVLDKYLACSATVDEYKKALMYGQVDIDSTLDKFNSELEENGINDIIAEMQKQYDELLANK